MLRGRTMPAPSIDLIVVCRIEPKYFQNAARFSWFEVVLFRGAIFWLYLKEDMPGKDEATCSKTPFSYGQRKDFRGHFRYTDATCDHTTMCPQYGQK